MRFEEKVYTKCEGIEEYVINGAIGVYQNTPPALEKYPEFTIDEAQLAAFQSILSSDSVCWYGDSQHGR